MEASLSRSDGSLSSRSLPEKSDAFHKFPGFTPRLKWAILFGIIAALVTGLIFSIDRFMGYKTNVIPDIHDRQATALKPPSTPDPSEEKTEEMKEEVGMATKTLNAPPPSAINIQETKSSAVVSDSSSESATKKPSEKKATGKESVMVVTEPLSPSRTTDGFDTGFKGKSDTAPKDNAATTAIKSKHHSCKDIYLKISLGEKLSAEEQRIINNCR
jgi:hypothetical protein